MIYEQPASQPLINFEDQGLLILEKPSGWIVNEAETAKKSPVIQAWLKKTIVYPLVQSRSKRSGIVHRLDKETSGLLIVAKTRDVFENLQRQFKNREVEKSYIALVHGKVDPLEGTIRAPVGRLPWNRERFGVLVGGREAVTKYEVIKNFAPVKMHKLGFTLLQLYPRTGRTHQIRIHLKYIGHPIVSDDFYAGRKTARSDRKWCPRLFLHAAKISLKNPRTGKKNTFTSGLPQELLSVLASLEKDNQTP